MCSFNALFILFITGCLRRSKTSDIQELEAQLELLILES